MREKKSTHTRRKVPIGFELDESEWSHHRVVVSRIKSLENSTAHACSFAFVPTRVRLLRRPVSNLTCNQNFTSYHSFLGLKFLKNVTMPWCNSSRKLDSLKIMNILQGRKNKELSRRSLCRHFRRWKCALHFQIVNWFVWSCVIVLSNLAVYLWSFHVICPLGLAYAPQKN